MVLVGYKLKIGWIIGLVTQALWLIFALSTEQYGFIIAAFGYGYVYARNWMRWHKEERAAAARLLRELDRKSANEDLRISC